MLCRRFFKLSVSYSTKSDASPSEAWQEPIVIVHEMFSRTPTKAPVAEPLGRLSEIGPYRWNKLPYKFN